MDAEDDAEVGSSFLRSGNGSNENKTTGLTLARPSNTNSPNPEECRSLATSRKRQKARSERECVQTGGIQELNGWSERSWAQSEGEKGGGGGESHRREGERDGGGRFYLFIFHPQLNSSLMVVNQGPVQLSCH